LILLSLVSFAHLQDKESFPEALCVANEFVTKIQSLTDLFENKNLTAIDLVSEVTKNVMDFPKAAGNCDRFYLRSKSWLNKIGYILLNRVPCGRNIGATLIMLDRMIRKRNDTEEIIANAIVSFVNVAHSYSACKQEIETLIKIWSPKNNTTPVKESSNTECLVHAILDDVTTLLREGDAFLRDPFMILNKIGIEVYSSFIQCRKQEALAGTKEFSILEKVAWSIMDGSKCERSLASALILLDEILYSEKDLKNKILNGLLTGDNLYNHYINCQNEIKLIIDIITSDEEYPSIS